MDRIRRALDLAREERVRNLAAPLEPPQSSEVKMMRRWRAQSAAAAVEVGPSPASAAADATDTFETLEAFEAYKARAVRKTRVVPFAAVEPLPAEPLPAEPLPVESLPVVEAVAADLRQESARPGVAAVEPRPATEVMPEPEEPTRSRAPVVELIPEPPEPERPAAAAEGLLAAYEATTVLLEDVLQTDAAAVPPPREYDAKGAAKSPTRIQYTKTKTFSPPATLLESHRIVDGGGAGAAASAFRMLRTQVLQRMEHHGWRSLAVMSPVSDDGKTTMAINLAINLANDHRHTVLLVEFDLRHPSIGDKLGIVPAMGVDDLLRGNARVEDCLYHPEGFDCLVVMPARAPMDNSSETLVGPQCRELVAELRDRYPDRLLVFDLPPVLGADDALAFAPLVDCALVVVAQGSTRRDDLLRCMELLHRTPIVGTVLNRATDAASAYG